MQNAAKTSRFLIDFSSEREFADLGIAVSHSKLLQYAVLNQLAHAANSSHVFNGLAHGLIRLAEHSFSLRDIDTLTEASLLLANLPITDCRQIGRYFQALAFGRIGQVDLAKSLLQGVADNAPIAYRARALQTLGSIYHRQGSHDEALRLSADALRGAAAGDNGRDLLTKLLVHLEISCIKSEMGDHRGALADYENLSPLVQIVARQNPLYFYLYHNELAIEFAELGRLAEAEAASVIALASPFAHAYPEWSETRDEIADKRKSASPSVVAIHRVPQVDRAPQLDRSTRTESQHRPKPVSALAFTLQSSHKDFFQRSIVPIPARTAVVLDAVSTLDRVLACIGPRAPPSRL